MRSPKPDPWTHFHEAFRQSDLAFKAIDWRNTDDWQHFRQSDPSDPTGRQTHRLNARNWRSRWRMCRLFLWLAWRIITRGKVTIKL